MPQSVPRKKKSFRNLDRWIRSDELAEMATIRVLFCGADRLDI